MGKRIHSSIDFGNLQKLRRKPCIGGTKISVTSILDFLRSEKRVSEIATVLNQYSAKIHGS
ncbi:DUF433 domain-containing protein [Paenibacillus puerhi]|uniref:DUF433 domain-containing protein n=1 Tax=Paenibacillus puerhi TaxID=2692622 RepID=UPI0038B3EA7B